MTNFARTLVAFCATVLFATIVSNVAIRAQSGPIGGSGVVGAVNPYVLGTASPTACTGLAPYLVVGSIINSSTAAQTATVTLYDESILTPTCASADQRYAITLTGSQVQPLNLSFYKGVVYKLSAAPTANIVIQPKV
jgi:hypothetical protein